MQENQSFIKNLLLGAGIGLVAKAIATDTSDAELDGVIVGEKLTQDEKEMTLRRRDKQLKTKAGINPRRAVIRHGTTSEAFLKGEKVNSRAFGTSEIVGINNTQRLVRLRNIKTGDIFEVPIEAVHYTTEFDRAQLKKRMASEAKAKKQTKAKSKSRSKSKSATKTKSAPKMKAKATKSKATTKPKSVAKTKTKSEVKPKAEAKSEAKSEATGILAPKPLEVFYEFNDTTFRELGINYLDATFIKDPNKFYINIGVKGNSNSRHFVEVKGTALKNLKVPQTLRKRKNETESRFNERKSLQQKATKALKELNTKYAELDLFLYKDDDSSYHNAVVSTGLLGTGISRERHIDETILAALKKLDSAADNPSDILDLVNNHPAIIPPRYGVKEGFPVVKPEPETEPEPQPKTEAKSSSATKTKSPAKTKSKPATKTKSKPKPQPKPKTKAELATTAKQIEDHYGEAVASVISDKDLSVIADGYEGFKDKDKFFSRIENKMAKLLATAHQKAEKEKEAILENDPYAILPEDFLEPLVENVAKVNKSLAWLRMKNKGFKSQFVGKLRRKIADEHRHFDNTEKSWLIHIKAVDDYIQIHKDYFS